MAKRLHSEQGVLADEGQEGGSGKKHRAGVGNRRGVGRKLLARKYRDFAERLSRCEDVQDVFFSVGREFEDFDPAVDDQVEAVALVPFGKNDFPLAKALLDGNSPDVGQLFTAQAAEEGDRGDDGQCLVHALFVAAILTQVKNRGRVAEEQGQREFCSAPTARAGHVVIRSNWIITP